MMPLLLTSLVLGLPMVDQEWSNPALELESVVSSDAVLAGALSPDGKRAFAVEGLRLVELEWTAGQWKIVDAVGIDVEPLALEVDADRIYLAGGTHGCLAVEYGVGLGEPYTIATEPGSVCTDVCSFDGTIGVLFSDYARITVHVLEAKRLSTRQRVRMSGTRAYAIELSGSAAFLAEGERGVRRLDLDAEHPASTSHTLPLGSGTYARDIDIANERLWVAAGPNGLIEVDLRKPWGRPQAQHSHGPGNPRSGVHAVRVAASGQRVVLGTSGQSAQAQDALPMGLLGAPGDPKAWPEPVDSSTDAGGIQVFDLDSAGSGCGHYTSFGAGSWRSLALSGDRLLALRAQGGLHVTSAEEGLLRLDRPRSQPSFAPLDGYGLSDGALLFGRDAGETELASGLRLLTRTAHVWTSDVKLPNPGFGSAAAWRTEHDEAVAGKPGSVAWVAIGGSDGLNLWKKGAPESAAIELPPSMLPLGPGTPVHVLAFGEFLAVSRPATHFGLAVYRKSAVEAFGSGLLPAAPNPAAVLRTSPDDVPDPAGVWRCAAMDMGGERWLLVCAAGYGQSESDSDLRRPRMLTYLVDADGVRNLAETLGADGPGLATSIAAFQERGRRWALLGSLGGQLELFDLTDPGAPHSVVHQPMAPTAWDASPPALLDLEVVQHAGQATQALVAAGRSGLLRFDLGALQSTPPRPDLIADEVLDTPGWATGIVLAPSPQGGKRVVVGDQRGGARIYSWRFARPVK